MSASRTSGSDVPDDVRASTVTVEMLGEGVNVAVVTFSAGRNNYVNYELLDQLASTLEGLESTASRAVVIRTTSRHFCAGADFSGGGRGQIRELVPRLVCSPLPVVAAVGGAAIGAGLGLALAADFRVATRSAYFLANFTRLGISQGFAVSLTLPRLVGAQQAAEMLYTARRVGGEEALALGLCDRLAEQDRLDDEAIALATEIAKSSPLALSAARRVLRADLKDEIDATLERERSEQLPLMDTEDFREGVRAWREKRIPEFRGI